MEKSKFKAGDILRHKTNLNEIYYVIDVKYFTEVDDHGRYPETYEWYEYTLWSAIDNCEKTIRDCNDSNYDVIMHRFIFEDIEPFAKVLVYNMIINQWSADLISAWGPWQIHTVGLGEFTYKEVIPFNKNTEDLINTSLEQNMYHNFSTLEEIKNFIAENPLSNTNIYRKLIY